MSLPTAIEDHIKEVKAKAAYFSRADVLESIKSLVQEWQDHMPDRMRGRLCGSRHYYWGTATYPMVVGAKEISDSEDLFAYFEPEEISIGGGALVYEAYRRIDDHATGVSIIYLVQAPLEDGDFDILDALDHIAEEKYELETEISVVCGV